MGTAAAGLAVGAGSVGAGSVSAGMGEPNYQVPPDERGPLPEPAIIVEPTERRCATLEVTKVVNGTAPDGTIFRVVVQCEPAAPVELPRERTAAELPEGQFPPFSTVLEFPATGGTQQLFLARPSSCTLSETAPLGCTLASIVPDKVVMTQPNVFQALVTNICAPPAPASTVNIQGTIVVSEPATPAPVVARPRFTG